MGFVCSARGTSAEVEWLCRADAIRSHTRKPLPLPLPLVDGVIDDDDVMEGVVGLLAPAPKHQKCENFPRTNQSIKVVRLEPGAK